MWKRVDRSVSLNINRLIGLRIGWCVQYLELCVGLLYQIGKTSGWVNQSMVNGET